MLRLLDGLPAMLERSTFVERVGRLLFDFDPDGGSLYAYLTDAGVDLHGARHTMDAVAADETDADLLDIAVGSPLLRERRRATASDGLLLQWKGTSKWEAIQGLLRGLGVCCRSSANKQKRKPQ